MLPLIAAHPSLRFNPSTPIIGNSSLVFNGNSLGAVLGATLFAISPPPSLPRAALGVVGAPFALILPRSDGFVAFLAVLMAKWGGGCGF